MAVFIDSGILLRAVHRSDPRYLEVRKSIAHLASHDTPLFTGLQHFAEFWNVCTRPIGERGGFNLPLDEAARRLRRIERGVKLLTETPITPEIWKSLVQKHGVKGVQVHDARTVALMMTHAVTKLLTLNKSDFLRYEGDGLVASTPAEMLEGVQTNGLGKSV